MYNNKFRRSLTVGRCCRRDRAPSVRVLRVALEHAGVEARSPADNPLRLSWSPAVQGCWPLSPRTGTDLCTGAGTQYGDSTLCQAAMAKSGRVQRHAVKGGRLHLVGEKSGGEDSQGSHGHSVDELHDGSGYLEAEQGRRFTNLVMTSKVTG